MQAVPDEAGKPGGKRWVKKWVGVDVPDFAVTKAPDTPADPKGVGLAFHDGASRWYNNKAVLGVVRGD